MTNEEIAAQIIKTLGGTNNFIGATNCMTRLRVHLVNKDDAMLVNVKNSDDVIINDNGVMEYDKAFGIKKEHN